jgi:hypothetical protein
VLDDFFDWGWHNQIFFFASFMYILLPIQVLPSYLIWPCLCKAYQPWFWSQGSDHLTTVLAYSRGTLLSEDIFSEIFHHMPPTILLLYDPFHDNGLSSPKKNGHGSVFKFSTSWFGNMRLVTWIFLARL